MSRAVPNVHCSDVTTAVMAVVSPASTDAGLGPDDLAPSTPPPSLPATGPLAAEALASRRAKVVAPKRGSACLPGRVECTSSLDMVASVQPSGAWVMMPRCAADLSSCDRHDMLPCLPGVSPGGFADGAVTSHLLEALRGIPLAAIERTSGTDPTTPEASEVDSRHIVFSKSQPFDRAATAPWRAVGVRVDCRGLTESAHPTEEWSRPTALRQDKSREVRPGRTVEELKQINHFARGAFRHCTSSLRTSDWKNETKCTSRLATWSTWAAGCSAAPRVFRPFCPGRAPCQTAAMAPHHVYWETVE